MSENEIIKSINLSALLLQKQIELLDNLSNAKVFKFEQKGTLKKTLEILEKQSDLYVKFGKAIDAENYKFEMNRLHKYIDRLDVFLEKIYKEEK